MDTLISMIGCCNVLFNTVKKLDEFYFLQKHAIKKVGIWGIRKVEHTLGFIY